MGQIKNIKLHIVTDIKHKQPLNQPTTNNLSTNQPISMQNDAGEVVDVYIPRKCSINNNISAKDHASVQISVAEVDEEGRMTGRFKTYAFCGKVRAMGEADDSFTNLCVKDGLLSSNYNL